MNRFGLWQRTLQDDALRVCMHEFTFHPDLTVIVRGNSYVLSGGKLLWFITRRRGDQARC